MCSCTVSPPISFATPGRIPSELIVDKYQSRHVSDCSEQSEQRKFNIYKKAL
jgi:hypothetical protein